MTDLKAIDVAFAEWRSHGQKFPIPADIMPLAFEAKRNGTTLSAPRPREDPNSESRRYYDDLQQRAMAEYGEMTIAEMVAKLKRQMAAEEEINPTPPRGWKRPKARQWTREQMAKEEVHACHGCD